MTKYDEAVAEAQVFAEKYRDASLPILILVAKTSDDDSDYLTIEKVATVSHFTEKVQNLVLAVATKGDEVAAKGTN